METLPAKISSKFLLDNVDAKLFGNAVVYLLQSCRYLWRQHFLPVLDAADIVVPKRIYGVATFIELVFYGSILLKELKLCKNNFRLSSPPLLGGDFLA